MKRRYPIQDETWPSRRWNQDRTDYIDLSGHQSALSRFWHKVWPYLLWAIVIFALSAELLVLIITRMP